LELIRNKKGHGGKVRYSYRLTLYQFHVGAYGAHVKDRITTLWSEYPYPWHQNQNVQGPFTICYPPSQISSKREHKKRKKEKEVCIVLLYS
jgi:hypothetical protein